jgi:hypothetical protein
MLPRRASALQARRNGTSFEILLARAKTRSGLARDPVPLPGPAPKAPRHGGRQTIFCTKRTGDRALRCATFLSPESECAALAS